MNLKTLLASMAISMVACAAPVSAHTTSLGYVPGTTAGTVNFYTGSYEHGGTVLNEGTFTLTGVDVLYNAVVSANILPTNTKPVGLVDGVNNFFWVPSGSTYTFPNSVDPNLFGGVVHWQGISFTGLLAGTYDFTCGLTCGTTQQWASLSTVGGANGTVRITLTGRDVGGAVPEPATWAMMLLGIGMVGASMRRRQKVAVRYAF
ncbi:MAG: PEPxxWA-CTERM sorting domain-containing protein [Novosphingobium sp.]